MKSEKRSKTLIYMSFILLICLALMTACSSKGDEDTEIDTKDFVTAVETEPDTVDFQCTTIYYTVAQNVFDRLVNIESSRSGNVKILPSLAESWEVSDDGLTYTFHLNKNVKFSNGSPLTSSDVLYTFKRLLTHPDSGNRDIAACILGASDLMSGDTDQLKGFKEISDLDFSITLEEPFEAFLACLAMPGASILDEETTEEAGDLFGKDAEHTIGTGSFILTSWEPGKGMILTANKDCWAGAPFSKGLDLRFEKDVEVIRSMFDDGELDIMDLDELDNEAEYYIRGDIFKDRLYQAQQVGTTYIALNSSKKPLDDVRVRKALQLGLNRKAILKSAYSGRANLENGIYPHGLYGFDPDIPEIPYDIEKARELLSEAGYPDGFDMTISVKASSTQRELDYMKLVSEMWEGIGVRADIEVIDESEFMERRKSGDLECYTASWVADYNDPDNFIYTFFGNENNTRYRSLCYQDEKIMERVRKARAIPDPDERIREYRALERKIVQEDAAWIPLFSKFRYYVTSERLEGFRVAWTGFYTMNYREMSIDDAQ